MEKIVIALFVVLLVVQIQDSRSDDAEIETKAILDSKCLDKEKLVLADVLEFALEDKFDLAEKNPKLKCFASCFLEYSEIMKGCTVVFDKSDKTMEKLLPSDEKEEFAKSLDFCKKFLKGTDRCECGYQMIKCLTEREASLST